MIAAHVGYNGYVNVILSAEMPVIVRSGEGAS